MRYRKKPVVIEARLATEPEEIHTLEGVMRANVGDDEPASAEGGEE